MKDSRGLPPTRPLDLRRSLLLATTLTAVAPLVTAQVQVPDLTTYASIDEALAGEVLVGAGSHWRFFVGVEDPGEELAWAKAGYDDAPWREGQAPFGYGPGAWATSVSELKNEASTCYFRYVLEVEDPELYESVELVASADDGFIFYLNGEEEDRQAAGIFVAARHTAFASSDNEIGELPLSRTDLSGKLLAGDNILALQGLVAKEDRDSFGFDLRIRGVFNNDPQREQERFDELAKLIPGARPASRLAYLEGRYLQRLGKLPEAAAALTRASELDTTAAEPLRALLEVHREADTVVKLDAEWRDLIDSGWATPALLDMWAELSMDDLGRDPTAFVGVLPERTPAPDRGLFADLLWIGAELAAGRPLRVSCGARKDEPDAPDDAAAPTWSRDRWARNGLRETWGGGEVAAPWGTARSTEKEFLDIGPMYDLPVPDGDWALTLYLPATSEPFDLWIEDALVRRALVVAAEGDLPGGTLRVPVRVSDGSLGFDLIPHTLELPRLAGFELEPLAPEVFAKEVERQVTLPEAAAAWAQLQLAHVRAAAGDPRGALAALEAVEDDPGFRPADAEYLGRLRESLLPEVPSLATADWLVAHRDRLDTKAVLQANADKDENAAQRAAYLEAELLLAKGKVDEAVVLFEELCFGDDPRPESVLGMVACLRTADLGEEAEGILFDAVENGLPLTDDVLLMLLTLNLEDMGRDPWETLERVAGFDLPDRLVIVPSSEQGARSWEYTPIEPTTVTWCRSSYDASWWERGPGGIGNGLTRMSHPASLWDGQVLFARTPFELPTRQLLYPYSSVSVNDWGDVYLNGIQVSRTAYRTVGYIDVPMRKDNFLRGENFVGLYAVNTRGPGFADVGIHVPLAELLFLRETLVQAGVLRINCGGPAWTDAAGNRWSEDRFFVHGQPALEHLQGTTVEIEGTEDDELYRTHTRYVARTTNDDGYRIPVPDGRYRVTLHFAEIDPKIGAGERIYDVQLEGDTVIDKLELRATPGPNTAVVHPFDVLVTDGWLDVDFVQYKDRGEPILSGLVVERP